jgi:hypothetical protein
MKKLLVSGCSVTHGAELYNGFMHPENVKKSFSQHLSNKLGCDLVNVALSAASNEYIFHSLAEQIKKINDIHSVVVVWTTPERLYWKSKNRHYFFLGNFATSMVDLNNFKMHDKQINNCWFTGDNNDIVERISTAHRFFVTDYFDFDRDTQYLDNYKFALSEICNFRNIKLVSLEWNDLATTEWRTQGRHPDATEHIQIAELIHKQYYEN